MRQRSFEVRYEWTREVVVLYRALAMVSIPSEARRVNFQHQTRSLRYDSERGETRRARAKSNGSVGIHSQGLQIDGGLVGRDFA
jgi:hypothetical protein